MNVPEWDQLRRVAVLIDAANLEKSVEHLGWRIHYRRLHTFFAHQTRLTHAAFYSVWYDTLRIMRS